jgi:hypothetical protein
VISTAACSALSHLMRLNIDRQTQKMHCWITKCRRRTTTMVIPGRSIPPRLSLFPWVLVLQCHSSTKLYLSRSVRVRRG